MSSHWFEYYGQRLPVVYHMYNLTHLNERMVELAIFQNWYRGKSSLGLEVGNVTGHYWQMEHDVIDLHEPRAWYQEQDVQSMDILDLPPIQPQRLGQRRSAYPWVASISTIEHTADPILALAALRSLVRHGGSLLVTFPMGERKELDALALNGGGSATRFCTIVREDNDHGGWAQTPEPVWKPYGPWANSVCVLEWEAPL